MKFLMRAWLFLGFVFLLSALWCSLSPDNYTVYAQTYWQQNTKRIRAPLLDEVIKQIHGDLKELRFKYFWFNSYGDDCLRNPREGSWIYYAPTRKYEKQYRSQLSEQLGIGYGPSDPKQDFKYWSNEQDENTCRFPTLGAKVYIYVMNFNKEKNPGLVNAIRYIVLKRCKALQRKIANPDINTEKIAVPRQRR